MDKLKKALLELYESVRIGTITPECEKAIKEII